jgi:tetratricopeptide (TPR) repeat protein/DNA-binding SARP family transcriptional activator
LLGDDLLVSDGTSYRLAVTAGQLDALEFVLLADRAGQAAAAGNHAAACRWYERALRLWRGEPLDDVSAMRGHPAVTSLAQHRTAVILDHAAAAAATGRPEQVLAQLQALAAHDPLDERVHARLMLTLAACGQQAAALSVFEQVRERLGDELGIIPGAELMGAHLRILRGELRFPAAALADRVRTPRPAERVRDGHGAADRAAGRAARKAATPRQLPAGVGQFTGRARELAVLSRLADQAARGTGTVVISAIGGMAGIGKTALAVHLAHRVAGRFPAGQLYANLRGFGPSGTPAAAREVIRGFLDALGVPPGQIPAGLDAQAALYRSATAGRRLLIVLDNARDEQQVRPLLPSTPGCLVLVTSRNQLTGLSAAEGAHLLTLDVLTGADAHALLTARLGTDRAASNPEAVAEIAALCGRLPLALAVTAARAAARPTFTMAALAAELRDTRSRLTTLDTGDPAVSVRVVFSWSYAQLAQGPARTFRLLGLHPGPGISVPAAASLAGVPPGRAGRHLAELARAHLVTETSPGRYALHDLLRAYATEQAEAADADRRAAVHRMLDHYLYSADAASALLYPARGPIAPGAPRPGVTPEIMTDDRAALAWLTAEHRVVLAVIARAADGGFDGHAQRLPEVMATYLDRLGLWHDCAGAQRVSLAAAERRGDLAGQARALRFLGRSRIRLGAHDDGYAHLTRAMDLFREAGDALGQARSHLALAMALGSQGRAGEALGHCEQALSLFRTVGHRAGEGAALTDLGNCHAALGACELALAEGAQALDLHRELGNRDGQAEAWSVLGQAHRRLGHAAKAIGCYRQAMSLLEQLGQPYNKAVVLTDLGDAQHAAGRAEEACQAWQQAVSILEGLHHPDAEQVRARLAVGA